jgi:hypothetical protein
VEIIYNMPAVRCEASLDLLLEEGEMRRRGANKHIVFSAVIQRIVDLVKQESITPACEDSQLKSVPLGRSCP